jgi:hypothetical protein
VGTSWGRRIGAAVPVAAILLVSAFAGSTSVAKPPPPEYTEVELTWTPDSQDIQPGSPVVIDTFVSEGHPFGRHIVSTRNPRSQVGTDTRAGKWSIALDVNGQGVVTSDCHGTFRIERVVLQTTTTEQTVKYGGVVKIKDCTNAKKFRRLEPGKLGELQGETTCTISRCTGDLDIDGHIKY